MSLSPQYETLLDRAGFQKYAPELREQFLNMARELADEMRDAVSPEQERDAWLELAKPYDSSHNRRQEGPRRKSTPTVKIGDAAPMSVARLQNSVPGLGGIGLGMSVREAIHQGVGFPGWPALSTLELQADFKNIVITRVDGVLRTFGKWDAVKNFGDKDEDKKKKLAELNRAIIEFDCKQVIRDMLRADTTFGIGFAIIVLKGDDTDEALASGETETPLSDQKLGKGCLSHFNVMDPDWLSPDGYSADNPASKWWYKPRKWWASGLCLDESRCLVLITRPVPQLWKPAYNFGGMSLLYMAKTAVDNWRQARDNVALILATMRTMVLQTDIADLLSNTGRDKLKSRIREFLATRNNMGLFIVGEKESVQNLHSPLGGLDKLQAQAQEHIASITQIPVSEFTGNEPSGLNASSEAILRLAEDKKSGIRENYLYPIIRRMSEIIQYHLWGKICLTDEDIEWTWDELTKLSPEEQREAESRDARDWKDLQQAGIMSDTEVRTSMVNNKNHLADGLIVNNEIDLPNGEEE